MDLNADGTNEFAFSIGLIITLDYPTSGGTSILTLDPSPEVAVVGTSIYSAPLEANELIGPGLSDGLAWVETTYDFDVASRNYNFRTGQAGEWRGVMGDPKKPFLGVRFWAADGLHYGWIRFGHKVGVADFPAYFGTTASIIEWAYESDPDTPIIITLPETPNDVFASATELTETSFGLWSDDSIATVEPGEPNPENLGAGASLWWKWTAPTNGQLWVASATGPFATVHGMFTGSSVEALTEVAASRLGCVGGSPGVNRETQFPVTEGTAYFIKVDSRVVDTGSTPRGEIHLQGAFSTVGLTYPQAQFGLSAGLPIHLLATATEWDGPRQELWFEADGLRVATAVPGAMNAFWHDPAPGTYSLRAAWQATDGVIRRSPPTVIQVRPANDEFFSSPFIQGSSISARATNRHASREEGEPAPPPGSDTNSIWWRWTAPADGVITVDVPDGNGELSLAICWGYGPWVSDVVEIASNGPDPARPGRQLDHLQLPVGKGAVYAIAIRSMSGATPWRPLGECDPPPVSGRDFTFRFNFIPNAAGELLVARVPDGLVASFAATANRPFALEATENFAAWDEVAAGVTTGVMQFLPIESQTGLPYRFFRLRLDP